MTLEEVRTHQDRVNLGDTARNFLASKEWNDLVKPIIDSMIKGLVDIRDIKKVLLSSDKKASITVEARAQAVESLEAIEKLLEAHVTDGEISKKTLEAKQKQVAPDPLFKVVE